MLTLHRRPPAADLPRSGVRKSEPGVRRRGEHRTGHSRNETQRAEIGGRMECELLTVSLQQPTAVIHRAAFLVDSTRRSIEIAPTHDLVGMQD